MDNATSKPALSPAADRKIPGPLSLFRKLLPKDDTFVSLFAAHAGKGVEAAVHFSALLADPAAGEAHYASLKRVEKEADRIGKDTIRAVHRTLITPFDRSDILELSKGLDDVVDYMKNGGYKLVLYGVEVTPQMLGMAECIRLACDELAAGIPLLAAVERNAAALNAMCERIDAIESRADLAFDEGLKHLYRVSTVSPGAKLQVEKVYELIEEVVDRCEDIADLVQTIVAEQV